jgi:hypothetical protein
MSTAAICTAAYLLACWLTGKSLGRRTQEHGR